MAVDPYKSGQFKKNPYFAKSDLVGRPVVTLTTTYETRGLQMIAQPSRCICEKQIHELILTDEEGVACGSTVNRIAYVGFVEITEGGVLVRCNKCGAQKLIATDSLIRAHDFLNCDSLTLE